MIASLVDREVESWPRNISSEASRAVCSKDDRVFYQYLDKLAYLAYMETCKAAKAPEHHGRTIGLHQISSSLLALHLQVSIVKSPPLSCLPWPPCVKQHIPSLFISRFIFLSACHFLMLQCVLLYCFIAHGPQQDMHDSWGKEICYILCCVPTIIWHTQHLLTTSTYQILF